MSFLTIPVVTPAVTGTLFGGLVLLKDGIITMPANTVRQIRSLPKAVVGMNANGRAKSLQLSTTASSVSGTSPTVVATLQRNAFPFNLSSTIGAINNSATTIVVPNTATNPTVGELLYLVEYGNANGSNNDDQSVTRETVRVTAVGANDSGGTGFKNLTVVRGVEGTTGVAFTAQAVAFYSNNWVDVPHGTTGGSFVSSGSVSLSNGVGVGLTTIGSGYPETTGIDGTYFRIKYVMGGTSPSAVFTGNIVVGN